MERQVTWNQNESLWKGIVTPKHVANIVDKYLSDNNFVRTLSVFREEASSFFSGAPFGEVPKCLMNLGAILSEYLIWKEEKMRLEKLRRDNFLREVMCSSVVSPSVIRSSVTKRNSAVPQPALQFAGSSVRRRNFNVPQPASQSAGSSITRRNFAAPQPASRSAGCSMYQSNVVPAFTPLSASIGQQSLFTPVVKYPLTRKRMGSAVAVEDEPAAKKTCRNYCLLPIGKTESRGTYKESCVYGSSTNKVTNAAPIVEVIDVESFESRPVGSSSPITPHQVDKTCISSIVVGLEKEKVDCRAALGSKDNVVPESEKNAKEIDVAVDSEKNDYSFALDSEDDVVLDITEDWFFDVDYRKLDDHDNSYMFEFLRELGNEEHVS